MSYAVKVESLPVEEVDIPEEALQVGREEEVLTALEDYSKAKLTQNWEYGLSDEEDHLVIVEDLEDQEDPDPVLDPEGGDPLSIPLEPQVSCDCPLCTGTRRPPPAAEVEAAVQSITLDFDNPPLQYGSWLPSFDSTFPLGNNQDVPIAGPVGGPTRRSPRVSIGRSRGRFLRWSPMYRFHKIGAGVSFEFVDPVLSVLSPMKPGEVRWFRDSLPCSSDALRFYGCPSILSFVLGLCEEDLDIVLTGASTRVQSILLELREAESFSRPVNCPCCTRNEAPLPGNLLQRLS